MREIKFRAWDNDQSGWHEFDVNDLKPDGKKNLRLISSDGSFTIEQFTGLKDKSGVEIFEGDAITIPLHEHPLPYGPSVHVGDDLGIVQWDLEYMQWIIVMPHSNDDGGLCDYDESEIEVVGNIHENPDLLSGSES